MPLTRQLVTRHHIAARMRGDETVLTPEATRILRGMLSLTPQRLADLSSVKKNNLTRFEKEGRPLSPRDRRWLQSTFEAAGADVFMGQGTLQVRLNGNAIITNGVAETLYTQSLPLGADCQDARWARGWSQRDAWKISGVPRTRISAIENNHPRNYHLAHQVALKKAFTTHKPLAERHRYAPY